MKLTILYHLTATACHARVGGLKTAAADTTLFENKIVISYDPNPIDDEDKDDNAESDGSNSRESSAKENVLPHEMPLVPEFRLVDASDDNETASHGVLSEHLFFDENKELKKRMVFGFKEYVQRTVK